MTTSSIPCDPWLQVIEALLSPLPADQPGDQALAARPRVRVGGTNYLMWLHVRLFLEQPQGGRS